MDFQPHKIQIYCPSSSRTSASMKVTVRFLTFMQNFLVSHWQRDTQYSHPNPQFAKLNVTTWASADLFSKKWKHDVPLSLLRKLCIFRKVSYCWYYVIILCDNIFLSLRSFVRQIRACKLYIMMYSFDFQKERNPTAILTISPCFS